MAYYYYYYYYISVVFLKMTRHNIHAVVLNYLSDFGILHLMQTSDFFISSASD